MSLKVNDISSQELSWLNFIIFEVPPLLTVHVKGNYLWNFINLDKVEESLMILDSIKEN